MGKPSGRWEYRATDSSVAFIVFRFDRPDGKTYRPVHPTPEGWVLGDPSGALPLYRLPELAGADRVYLTEGEKAAELAKRLGVVATTSAHGAKGAAKTDWGPLVGWDVVILPDHDPRGRAMPGPSSAA